MPTDKTQKHAIKQTYIPASTVYAIATIYINLLIKPLALKLQLLYLFLSGPDSPHCEL